MIYSVIMAGGRGERFWPLSRQDRPKQLLRLTSSKTMLQETIDRVLPLTPLDRTVIVTGAAIRDAILREISYLSDKHLLVEPQGRNTLYAIGLAAVHLEKVDPEAVMIVLSADHLIKPAERLHRILETGAAIAGREEKLITIGIVPTRPETGYGYIKLGDLHSQSADIAVYKVAEFAEKPQRMVAQEYYYGKKHLWNSGMFIWSARTILAAIEKHAPQAYALIREYSAAIGTPNEGIAREKLFREAQGISIDFAVLEKANNTLTIKANIIWDDVGSWNALERYMHVDSERNVIVGKAIACDSYEMTIYNEGDGMIATLGVSDLVVVRSGDLVLVAHKTKTEDIKDLLAEIGKLDDPERYI